MFYTQQYSVYERVWFCQYTIIEKQILLICIPKQPNKRRKNKGCY